MLHLDGSDHAWLALCPGKRQFLLLVIDDATGKNLAGCLVEGETTKDCMSVMKAVVQRYGIPAQIYTDRGSVFWHTKKTGGKVDLENLTQFGRAMDELGVEMIPGYSPQARGRGERWNGTWQGRLVAELRKEGITTLEGANKYINKFFIPDMNRRFSVEPREQGSAFVSADNADLDLIFSIIHKERTVYADNTARVNGLRLQIEESPYRISFAKCKVDIYEHLDGTYSIMWKKRCIGRYDVKGNLINFWGPAPQTSRDLLLFGIPDGQEKSGQSETPRPSVYPPALMLGSLPSVALSPKQATIRMRYGQH